MIRRAPHAFAVVLALSAGAALWAGCSRKLETEIVVGVQTQMRVPQDLQTVRLTVNGGGPVVFDQEYPVYQGVVLLPQTIGLQPTSGQPAATMVVIGYTDPPTNPPVVSIDDPSTRILRRAVVQYVDNQIVYLPMALRYSCYGVTCSDSQSCVAGACVDATIDSSKLAPYSPDLVFGNTSSCFSIANCFGAEEPPLVVDAAKCIFAMPNTASAPDAGPIPLPAETGTGVNVRIRYENLETEVLDNDPLEGFTIPDPTKPQQFQLSPGLCSLYAGASDPTMATPHQVIALGATGLCAPKAINQPLCEGEPADFNELPDGAPPPSFKYTRLTPTKTALYILLDVNTLKGFGESPTQTVLSLTLTDPLFRAIDVAFSFFQGATNCSFVPGMFTTASKAQQLVASELMSPPPFTSQLGADQALGAAYLALNGQLAQDPTIDRQALVVISSSDLTVGQCGAMGLPQSGASIQVYGVAGNSAAAPSLQNIATSGGFFNVSGAAAAPVAFNTIVADLGSCRYVAPTSGPPSGDNLVYIDPVSLQQVLIPPLGQGQTCSTGSGWSSAAGIVQVCGAACTTLHSAIEARSELAESVGQTPPDLPVFVQDPGP